MVDELCSTRYFCLTGYWVEATQSDRGFLTTDKAEFSDIVRGVYERINWFSFEQGEPG